LSPALHLAREAVDRAAGEKANRSTKRPGSPGQFLSSSPFDSRSDRNFGQSENSKGVLSNLIRLQAHSLSELALLLIEGIQTVCLEDHSRCYM
jgi:hypothetical protein